MLESLPREDRLRLIEFVCSFAWADLEIQHEERHFVFRLMNELGLEGDRERILGWLRSPPPPDDVDPTRVPKEHRELLLETARKLFQADGKVEAKEAEQFELLEQLLV